LSGSVPLVTQLPAIGALLALASNRVNLDSPSAG
jgi:hypothetical protein